MEYTFSFNAGEHWRAMRTVDRLSGAWRRQAAFALGLSCMVLGWTLVQPGPPGVADLWPLLLPPLLTFVLVPLLTRWKVSRIPTSDRSVRGELRRVVSDAGVEAHGNDVSMRFGWDGLRRAVETHEFFLFFYAPRAAYYIPKRAVPAAELPRLRGLLAQQLAGRTRLLDA